MRQPAGTWLLLLFTSVAAATAVPSHSRLVKDVHYGDESGLDIRCAADELILVESETLAYSGGGNGNSSDGGGKICRPQPHCSVPYSQASWYCRGQSVCRGMLIERQPLHRRTCGSDYTDCLHVEYQCVKSTTLLLRRVTSGISDAAKEDTVSVSRPGPGGSGRSATTER